MTPYIRSTLAILGLLVSMSSLSEDGIFGTSRFGSAQWAEPLDTDGDGVPDSSDVFPNDSSETSDFDGDGLGDNADSDDDNDGVEDIEDAFPYDPTESIDTDGDGIGNNEDADDDNDGLSDEEESALGTDPLLTDTDGDGVDDLNDQYPLDSNESADSDGDGVADGADAFPNDATESVDTDGDGIGNNADTDDDNDGIQDELDPEPQTDNTEELGKYDLVTTAKTYSVASEYAADRGAHLATISSEKENALIYFIIRETYQATPWLFPEVIIDGGYVPFVWLGGEYSSDQNAWIWETGESFNYENWGIEEPDSTNIGYSIAMGLEQWPYWSSEGWGIASEWNDILQDEQLFFVIETEGPVVDTDGDGIVDSFDAFPDDPTEWADSDGDGVGDNADDFPDDPNETTDTDGDGVGDNSDQFPDDYRESIDSDGDGVGDNSDEFPNDATETTDTDGDGIGNNADTDDDNDGIPDDEDLYPLDPNNDRDTDGDGIDDSVDFDDDNDGIPDAYDVEPLDSSLPFMPRHIKTYGAYGGVWEDGFTSLGADLESGIENTSTLDVQVLSWQIIDGENIERLLITSNIASDGILSPDEKTAYIARFSSYGLLAPISAVYTFMHPETSREFKRTIKYSPDGIDRDGDNIVDQDDLFPDDEGEWLDSDGDGVGDNQDELPFDSTDYLDNDGDGIGDRSDPDIDGDGIDNESDPFPNQGEYTLDTDGDGMPDSWEVRFGLDPSDPSDATSDEDNDGISALDEFLAGTPPSGSIDLDGNEQYDALTDGLLLLRGMFGLDGAALITGTVASDAVYTDSEDIESRIEILGDLADVDGNGQIDALTDGLLTLRYLFGLEGDTLINGVVAADATRTTAEEIEAHLEALMPSL